MPNTQLRRLAVVAILASVPAGAVAPTPAWGGEYTVYTCDTDPPEGVPASNDALVKAFPESLAFSTRGMLSTRSGRRCAPGRGTRGLVTMNYWPRGGTVPRGTRAHYVITAPAGTRFARLRWAGSIRRRDCRWALQIYTRGPGAGNAAIKNKPAGRDCPRHEQAQASGLRRLRTIPQAAGATKFVQRVICFGGRRSSRCSNRTPTFARTTALEVTVSDTTRPTAAIILDNPFTRGSWVSGGDRRVNYSALDNIGVKTVQAYVNGSSQAADSRPCDFRGLGGLIPCPNGRGGVAVDTRRLAEGSQRLALLASDSADNRNASTNAVTVRVDRTAPGAVQLSVAGGQGWRSTNSFSVGWQNPAERDRAPITAANYRLCPTGGGQCVNASRQGGGIAQLAGLAVPAMGAWRLLMWRSDAAGNQQPANASQPVLLRWDAEIPQLGFETTSAEDPTKLAVQVTDKVSGLAGGQIEISRQGSGSWQTLPTRVEGSRVTSRVDDARLGPGSYLVRAVARDQAANQGGTFRRLDGQPMLLRLPLRTATILRAGVAKRVRRAGKRRRVRVLRPRARVRYGRRVRLAGRLSTSDARPLVGSQIQVYSRTETSPDRLLDVIRTDRKGRYRYRARGTATRMLRFVYPGAARILPAQSEVTLLVPAASTIAVRPRRTVNGRRVRFRGRLRAPIPSKLVELQARLPGRWQTFRTLRTSANGVWRAGYRFDDTCATRRYRFRARLPRQGGYPYITGRTRTVSVRVIGRCR
jgi:hypothetical protein